MILKGKKKKIKVQVINTTTADKGSINQSLLIKTHSYKQLKTRFQTSRS